MRQRAGGDHNDNASNYGFDGSAATYYWRADNDNNDARGQRRLLIAKAGRGCVCHRHGPQRAVFAFEQQMNCNRPQAGGYSRDALRIFARAALRFGLALPRPDSLQARLPEAFRHCGDPLVSRPSYCGRSREFLSLACAPFGLCW